MVDMRAGSGSVPCVQDACAGMAVGKDGACIAHVGADERRGILERLQAGGPLDFTPGVRITEALFREILDAAPREHGRTRLLSGDFSGAVFEGEARFERTTFWGTTSFRDARFEQRASFERTTFRDTTSFRDARFEGRAFFDDASFQASVSFRDAIFASRTTFRRTVFTRRASFRRAAFAGRASFRMATFKAVAAFPDTRFERQPRFDAVTCEQTLELIRASFAEGFRIIDLQGGPEVVMEGVSLGASSALSGARRSPDRPRLVSLRMTDVEGLLLADIDLRACRFINAHNLDRLRLESGCQFAHPPGRLLSRQTVIAEEQRWRAQEQRCDDRRWRTAVRWPRDPAEWYPEESRPTQPINGGSHPEVGVALADIATIYRDLRRGRETSKDAPGAGDFYYGEMEMRRLDEKTPIVERGVLASYWLISGYGLRASRALAALALTVVLFGVLLHLLGYPPGTPSSKSDIAAALTFSAQSTTSLFRPSIVDLTLAGKWLEIGLRFLGPLFFGLALLSVRARIKR
jgi:hypothetical protein